MSSGHCAVYSGLNFCETWVLKTTLGASEVANK